MHIAITHNLAQIIFHTYISLDEHAKQKVFISESAYSLAATSKPPPKPPPQHISLGQSCCRPISSTYITTPRTSEQKQRGEQAVCYYHDAWKTRMHKLSGSCKKEVLITVSDIEITNQWNRCNALVV